MFPESLQKWPSLSINDHTGGLMRWVDTGAHITMNPLYEGGGAITLNTADTHGSVPLEEHMMIH